MIRGLTTKLDDIHKLYLPKMELFFAAHTPDMWVKSLDEFETAYQTGDVEITLQALAVYKYRRQRMLEIYKSYVELTQEALPRNPVIETIQEHLYSDQDEQTKRSLICCDRCRTPAAHTQGLMIIQEERFNNLGDPELHFRTVCNVCHSKRKSA